MKQQTVIYLIALLFPLVVSQAAFSQVENLLLNFKQDIVNEQEAANARNLADVAQCEKDIADATIKVESRQKDVDDLVAHIEFLKNEKEEAQKDHDSRVQRVADNEDLLARFKDQRCQNNLIFVKQLREHMEGIEILTGLRQDIVDYFGNKNVTASTEIPAFIERFSEFSHLLNDDKKMIFTQLSSSLTQLQNVADLTKQVDANTSTKIRTNAEVGTGQIDNNRDELARLDTPAYQQTAVYYAEQEARILAMIDNLIAHLKESRNELTKNEIQAAEDFAVFQTNIQKENDYLHTKIAELENTINDLVNQINVAEQQLVKREDLLEEAKKEKAIIEKNCQAKADYFAKETLRRTGEISTVAQAQSLFDNVLSNLSSRVKARASDIATGNQVGNDLSQNVVKNQDSLNAGVNANFSARKNVVF